MPDKFTGAKFAQALARKLVIEFADAGVAGTPTLVGNAREHPARQQLRKILPPTVDIGSGIVIDSFGGQSKQQDIVIYEKQFCPVFMVNDVPEATFYPVEGVVAVGEVKSGLDKATLTDSIEKTRSVRRLRRFAPAESHPGIGSAVPYRPYGSAGSYAATPRDQFDPSRDRRDRIYGFILAGRLDASADLVLDVLAEEYQRDADRSAPQLTCALDAGFFQRLTANNALTNEGEEAASVGYLPSPDGGFLQLLHMLDWQIRNGRTVSHDHFRRYLLEDPTTFPTYMIVKKKDL